VHVALLSGSSAPLQGDSFGRAVGRIAVDAAIVNGQASARSGPSTTLRRMADDIEYTGLVAEAWDALRGDTSGWADRQFFLGLIRERGEPVLDVGCGTGRLLLDFLDLGIDIDGIDNSDEMLGLLRRKAEQSGLDVRNRLSRQSMEDLRLERRYRTIIVPSSSFQLLIDPASARRTLGRFLGHLEPGGTLAMPFIRFSTAGEERWTAEATLPDGSLVRRTAVACYDPATRLESTDDLYEIFRHGELIRSERHVRPEATRAWTRDEVAAELARAGFHDPEWLSNFTREPARDDDDVFTALARRPTT
jgi:SAM-dependent methyltransferase